MLQERKITHILSCGTGGTLTKGFPEKYTYHTIEIDDKNYENISKFFDETYNFIENGETVFVHCSAGVSRSATLLIAYLMRKYKKGY